MRKLFFVLIIAAVPLLLYAQSVTVSGGVTFNGQAGPTGPTGPSGPTGATGATGPQGSSLSAGEYAQAFSPFFAVTQGGYAISSSNCTTFRGTANGVSRSWTQASSLAVDAIYALVDNSPNGGWLAGNPTADIYVYDMTSSTLMLDYAMNAAAVSASVSNGYVKVPLASTMTLTGTHTFRIGILYSAQGSGFCVDSNSTSSWGTPTRYYTTSYNTSIQSWSSNVAGGWAFSLQTKSTSSQPALTAPLTARTLVTSPTNVDTSLGGVTTSYSSSNFYALAMKYTPSSNVTLNILDTFPLTTMTGGAECFVQASDAETFLAWGVATNAEWNTAVARGVDLKILLNTPVTLSASTTYIIGCEALNNVDYINMPYAATSSEVQSQAIYQSVASSSFSFGNSVFSWLTSGSTGTAPYFALYYDASAAYVSEQDVLHDAANVVKGKPDMLLPSNLYTPLGTNGIWGTITYVSGGTATGSGYCLATASGGGGSGATGLVSVSSGTISGSLQFQTMGWSYTSVPTSWTLTVPGNGGASTCSGTITTSGGSLNWNSELNVYFDNLVRGYWNPGSSRTSEADIEVTANYGRQYNDKYRLQAGNSSAGSWYTVSAGAFSLTAGLYDAEFAPLASATSTVNVVDMTVTTNPVRWTPIGDSQSTDQGQGASATYVTPAAARLQGSVTLEGTRTYDGKTNNEGRPGWTVGQYTNTSSPIGVSICNSSDVDSPFVFPDGTTGANYRGNVAFWKNVVNGTGGSHFQGWTVASKEGTGSVQYSSSTGYPSSPTSGWVVCDPSKGSGHYFQTWNGSAWVDLSPQPSTYSVSFSKYMSRYAWAYTAGDPTVVSIMLGTNDCNVGKTDSWACASAITGLQTLVSSIQTYSSAIKILIMQPMGGAGQDGMGYVGGATGVPYRRFRRNMQDWSRLLMNTFDTSAMRASKVYFVSNLTAADPIDGWPTQNETRSLYCNSANNVSCTVTSNINNVHPVYPGVGYQQVGEIVAAAIQNWR